MNSATSENLTPPPKMLRVPREDNKLRLEDRAAHDWHRFVLSFPAHLVRTYLQRLAVGPESTVLDLRPVLRPGARLAYVVGDQASYLRIMIRTGQLLADLAKSAGYEVVSIDLFRTRLATATKAQLREEVVVLRWPGPAEVHGWSNPDNRALAALKDGTSKTTVKATPILRPARQANRYFAMTAQITAALLLLAGCGGSESPPPAAAKQEQVAATARRLANERAQALYRCQPFEVDRAPQWTNRHWVWRDRRGYGGGDVEAIVSLAPDLSTQSVQVLLLDSRTIEF